MADLAGNVCGGKLWDGGKIKWEFFLLKVKQTAQNK
jgi:hypothetical protein